MTITIRAVDEADRGWIAALVRDRWLDETVVGHGTMYRPSDLPGFAALEGDEPVGLVTYVISDDACEIVTIDALRARVGIGAKLVEAVANAARASACVRLWLITTNDNDDALAFYLACGFSLVAVHEGAVDEARALKPSIPLVNDRGVAIHDELELARDLSTSRA